MTKTKTFNVYDTLRDSVTDLHPDKLTLLVYRDAVTRTFNRAAFEKIITTDISVEHVLIFDMDSLKWINDTCGHDVGDQYLKKLAHMLRVHFTDSRVFRLGGDEFAVIHEGDGDYNYPLADMRKEADIFSFGVASLDVGDWDALKTAPDATARKKLYYQFLAEADSELRHDKVTRNIQHKRARRGHRPPWFDSGLLR